MMVGGLVDITQDWHQGLRLQQFLGTGGDEIVLPKVVERTLISSCWIISCRVE